MRPYVIINTVSSVDGRTTMEGKAAGIGSRTDRRTMRTLRSKVDAVMIGAGTLRAEKLSLGLDGPDGLPQPLAIIVTGSGEVALEEHLIVEEGQEVLILLSDAAPRRVFDRLRALAPVMEAPADSTGAVDLARALLALEARRGVESLLVEGGPGLNHALISRNLVDELFLTVAPQLLGGSAERTLTLLRGPTLRATVRPSTSFLSTWPMVSSSCDIRFPDLRHRARARRAILLAGGSHVSTWEIELLEQRGDGLRRAAKKERSVLRSLAGVKRNASGGPDNARRPPGVRDRRCPVHQALRAVPAGLAAVGDSGGLSGLGDGIPRQHGNERCPTCASGRARGERAGGAVELRSVRPGALGAHTRRRHPGRPLRKAAPLRRRRGDLRSGLAVVRPRPRHRATRRGQGGAGLGRGDVDSCFAGDRRGVVRREAKGQGHRRLGGAQRPGDGGRARPGRMARRVRLLAGGVLAGPRDGRRGDPHSAIARAGEPGP